MNGLVARHGLVSTSDAWMAAGLGILMTATRSHHWLSLATLPDASWAVLFLAGMHLRTRLALPLLCLLAALIDWVVIQSGGVSAFCVTPAYAMLLPAYATLWAAGRACQWRAGSEISLTRVLLAVMASAVLAEVFASGGFNYLGGAVVPPTWTEFLALERQYFPQEVVAMVLYVGLARLLDRVLSAVRGLTPAQR